MALIKIPKKEKKTLPDCSSEIHYTDLSFTISYHSWRQQPQKETLTGFNRRRLLQVAKHSSRIQSVASAQVTKFEIHSVQRVSASLTTVVENVMFFSIYFFMPEHHCQTAVSHHPCNEPISSSAPSRLPKVIQPLKEM